MKKAGIIPTTIRLLSQGQSVPLYGGGKTARDFVYVEDTARAVILALNSPSASGQIINIATGVARTMRQVVEDIASIMNTEPKIRLLPERDGDVSYLCGDGSKAKELLGFTPSTQWYDGLEKCINYYSKLRY